MPLNVDEDELAGDHIVEEPTEVWTEAAYVLAQHQIAECIRQLVDLWNVHLCVFGDAKRQCRLLHSLRSTSPPYLCTSIESAGHPCSPPSKTHTDKKPSR